jgi:hypothetical protein
VNWAAFGIGVMLAGSACGAAAQIFDGDLTSAQRRAISASGLPRASVVSVKRDLVVAIRNRGTSKGGVLVEGVTLQGEVVSAEAVRTLGYKSMRSTVNVDCARRRDMVTRMIIYPESKGRGEGVQRQVPGGWIQPSPDAYLGDVIRAVCANVAPAPMTVPVEKTTRTPPIARPVRQAAATPAPRIARPPVPPEPLPPAAPYGSELMVTAVGVRPAPQPSAQQVSQAAPPPPTLRPSVAPPALPAVKPAPRPVAPPPKREPPRASATPGKVRVQIAAVAAAANAQEALAKLGKLPAPLGRSVQAATVNGRTVHRALVTGFATRAEASAFCAKVERRGGACFIRP